jgi:hypothetical protein
MCKEGRPEDSLYADRREGNRNDDMLPGYPGQFFQRFSNIFPGEVLEDLKCANHIECISLKRQCTYIPHMVGFQFFIHIAGNGGNIMLPQIVDEGLVPDAYFKHVPRLAIRYEGYLVIIG